MAKKKSAKKNSVVWSIDAFSKDVAGTVLKAIRAFDPSQPRILPLYVLDFIAGQNDPRVTAKQQKTWQSKFLPLAHKELSSQLSAIGSEALQPKVLVQGTNSRRQSAETLIKAAKKEGASLIALSTHGRKGLSRLFLGSFAETLVTLSPIPVLSVNPNARVSDSIRTILFPTDFSKSSSKTFDVVVAKAAQLGAKIVLFHKFFSPVEPLIQSGVYMLGGGWVSSQQFIEGEEGAKKTLADKWIKLAAAKKVEVEFVTNTPDLAISNAICDTAERYRADLLVMVNQTGRWESVILGSVTREVLRESKIPVWVFHSKA